MEKEGFKRLLEEPNPTYRRQDSSYLHILYVIFIELQQPLVEIGLEHRCIADKSRGNEKDFFKSFPDESLRGVGQLRGIRHQGQVSQQAIEKGEEEE